MFLVGFLIFDLGLAMIVAGFVIGGPATIGLVAGGVALLLSGGFLGYLNLPSRRESTPPGMERGRARVLAAAATDAEVAGYRMVELTLEVTPENGLPFQVKRKVSSGRLGRIEPGSSFDVVFDPANPKKLELV